MASKLKRFFLVVIILCSSIQISFAKRTMMNDYHREVVLGEYLIDDFAYPYDLLIMVDDNTKQIFYRHHLIERDAVHSSFPATLNYLQFDFFPELVNVNRCPNYILSKHVNYIRYVFRLLTISYLFETLKDFKAIANKNEKKYCSINWDDLFAKCRPRGNEMKKFLIRIKPIYLSAYKKREVTLINDNEKKLLRDTWCGNKSSCLFLESSEDVCLKSRKLIIDMCSENDSIYGMSYIPEAARILKTSNVMNIINREGHGVGCLDRFTKLFKKSEAKFNWLKNIIPTLMKRNIRLRSRYLEGNLFLPGALREYDEQGLEDFLFALNPKTIKVKPRPAVTSVPKVVVTIAPTKIIKTVKALVKKTLPKKTKEIIKVKLSEFEFKSSMRKNRSLSKLAIDMIEFENDFVFDDKIIKKYDKTLKAYQTRTALIDMKSFDKLGTRTEPVQLKFLKYLIDTDKHQSLFNLQAVIGERFYVINDFENKSSTEYIKLENSERTKYKWQIYILAPER